ncbi:MAG: hypothetical protein [Caudoviricetes sp.]|nr:MAG: hypothetical protein [Caudoviricetes sp.]
MLSLAAIVTIVTAVISGIVGLLLGHSRGETKGIARGREVGYNEATLEQTTRAAQATSEVAATRTQIDETIADSPDDGVTRELLDYARDRPRPNK